MGSIKKGELYDPDDAPTNNTHDADRSFTYASRKRTGNATSIDTNPYGFTLSQ
jgi:hypothetical protein